MFAWVTALQEYFNTDHIRSEHALVVTAFWRQNKTVSFAFVYLVIKYKCKRFSVNKYCHISVVSKVAVAKHQDFIFRLSWKGSLLINWLFKNKTLFFGKICQNIGNSKHWRNSNLKLLQLWNKLRGKCFFLKVNAKITFGSSFYRLFVHWVSIRIIYNAY